MIAVLLCVMGTWATAEDSMALDLLADLHNLHSDLRQWNASLALSTYSPFLQALYSLNQSLSALNQTAAQLREDLSETSIKGNEIFSLEDSLLRLLSNLTGQFAVLQSKIVHLDDPNIGDTVEAAFNKPSPRKTQIYLSVLPTQANNSKEFATVLEELVQKEVTFRAIYGLLGVVGSR